MLDRVRNWISTSAISVEVRELKARVNLLTDNIARLNALLVQLGRDVQLTHRLLRKLKRGWEDTHDETKVFDADTRKMTVEVTDSDLGNYGDKGE